MNGEFEFGEYGLQPLSGVGEAMYVAGVDGRIDERDDACMVSREDEADAN